MLGVSSWSLPRMRAMVVAAELRRVQVIKRPGGRSPYWYLRWWEPVGPGEKPRERWRSTRTSVRKRAEQLRRELERSLESTPRPTAPLTWSQFEQEFLHYQAARAPLATVQFYRNSLRVFGRSASPESPNSVTTKVLDDFAAARLANGIAPATVNRDLRHVKAALNWAVRRGFLEKAPDFHGVAVREPKKKPTVMPEGDFLALVNAAESQPCVTKRRSGNWWRTFLYVGYYLGLRRGELLALSWRDVDVRRSTLQVQATSSKSRKERVLPMPDAIGRLLAQWRRSCDVAGGDDAVFPWPFDTLNPLYDDWRLQQDAAGIPRERQYAPKDLRSSCASMMIASSVPTMVVKDFLGHANVATTENYYVDTTPAMRAVANARTVVFNDAGKQRGEVGDADRDRDV